MSETLDCIERRVTVFDAFIPKGPSAQHETDAYILVDHEFMQAQVRINILIQAA